MMTTNRFKALALSTFALAAVFALDSRPAAAEVEYPWCAAYTGRDRGVVTCGFTSFQQCQATVTGVGGFCQRNPRLAYAPEGPRRQRWVR